MARTSPGLRSKFALRGLLGLSVAGIAMAQSAGLSATSDISIFQFQHTSWTQHDGAPPEINALAQDADGALWLGCAQGLYRFDGFQFKRISAIDDKPGSPTEVRALFALPNGDLWIGTSFSGAILLRGGKAIHHSKFEGLPAFTGVASFAKDPDGDLWAGTASGVQRFDGKVWHKVGRELGLPEMRLFHLFRSSDGTFWATDVLSNRFRRKPDGGIFESVGIPGKSYPFVAESPSGSLWESTGDGVCRLLEGTKEPSTPRECIVRGKHLVSKILFDNFGDLWIGSIDLGVKRLRSPLRDRSSAGGLETLSGADGLTSDIVLSIIRDHDGSVWAGTAKGLDHFRRPSFVPAFPVTGTRQFAIQMGDRQEVTIAGEQGFLTVDSAGHTTRQTAPREYIQCLYRSTHGLLWASSSRPISIWRSQDSAIEQLPIPEPLLGQLSVQSMAEDGNGNLWVSFIPSGLFKWDGKAWTRDGGLIGMPKGMVAILNGASDGRVWAGYVNGDVAAIDRIGAHRYTSSDGAKIGAVMSILNTGQTAWLGGEDGLLHFDGRRFQSIQEADGRPFAAVTGIVLARNGDLWLNDRVGVRHISSAELRLYGNDPRHLVHAELFDTADGLPGPPNRVRPFSSAVTGKDGRHLWFAFTAGVVTVDPEDKGLAHPIPAVSISSVQIEKSLADKNNIQVAPRSKNLQIDYSAVDLNYAGRVRFKYKLDGYDVDWLDVGARRQAYYGELQPGTYRFHVIASNGDFSWSEDNARIDIHVQAAFTQTIWFSLLLAGAGLMAIWAIFQLRIRQIAAKMKLRFDERIAERNRLSGELHDTLLQSVQASRLIADQALRSKAVDTLRLRRDIETLSGFLAQATTEGRTALNNLRISTEQSYNLEEAFQKAAETFLVSRPMKLVVSAEGEPREMHPIVREEIYRIGCEAIRNACLHSEGNELDVTISYAQNLTVRVRDDGKGVSADISSNGKPGHYGLRVMQERASRVGGKLRLSSRPDSGTEIALIVPGDIVFVRSGISDANLFSGLWNRWRKSNRGSRQPPGGGNS